MLTDERIKELADWLENEAEKRMKQAVSRRPGANDRKATEAELKASKKMAEKMTGRKLDLVSTTVKANIAYCDMQDRIACKLEAEAKQLYSWAEAIRGQRIGDEKEVT